MKVFLIFVMAFAMALFAGNLVAHGGGGGGRGAIEEGLAVGLEYGVQEADHEIKDGVKYIRPYFGYANRLFDETLFMRIEADVTTGFHKDEDNENALYLNFEFEFDRRLDAFHTFTFLLQKEFDDIILSPRPKDQLVDGDGLWADRVWATGIVSPGVRLTREFENKDQIYTEVRLPITWLYDYTSGNEFQSLKKRNKQNSKYGLDYTLGWESAFGLCVEGTLVTTVGPRTQVTGINPNSGRPTFTETDVRGINNVELAFIYEVGRYYFGLDLDIKRTVNQSGGVMITPMVSVNVGHFDIYGYWVFDHVRRGWDDTTENSLALGVRWTIFD